ncbi:MAG: molybdate ABC transporter permease subunit, partial [Actinomycetota bacterium]
MTQPVRRSTRSVRRPPILLIVLAVIGAAVFVVPLVGLLSRTPWGRLPDLLTGEIALEALRLSILASLGATAISTLFGVPLAWVLARVEFPGRAIVRGLVLLPLVLPPVVGGAALLFALGRRGLFGEPLYEATGLVLPFSTWGVVVATTFVAMPFLV